MPNLNPLKDYPHDERHDYVISSQPSFVTQSQCSRFAYKARRKDTLSLTLHLSQIIIPNREKDLWELCDVEIIIRTSTMRQRRIAFYISTLGFRSNKSISFRLRSECTVTVCILYFVHPKLLSWLKKGANCECDKSNICIYM